jgi:hypothetical protein
VALIRAAAAPVTFRRTAVHISARWTPRQRRKIEPPPNSIKFMLFAHYIVLRADRYTRPAGSKPNTQAGRTMYPRSLSDGRCRRAQATTALFGTHWIELQRKLCAARQVNDQNWPPAFLRQTSPPLENGEMAICDARSFGPGCRAAAHSTSSKQCSAKLTRLRGCEV